MEDKLKRLEGESVKQYKLRLFRNKDMYNTTTQEIADLINKETENNYNESTYRKWFKAYEEGYIDAKEEDVSDNDVLNEIELKRIELEKEKIRFSDQRREYKKLIVEQARTEHLKNEFIKMVDSINNVKPLRVEKYPTAKGNKEGLLLLSDWHFGLACSNFWNEFNTDIFYKRINKLLNKTIEYGKLNNIKTLHIFNLADLQNGLIHVTTRIENEENTVRQTQIVAETLADMVSELAKEFEEVKVYNTIGNHERISPNKSDSLYNESFAEFIPWYLEARLCNIKNVQIVSNDIDKSIIVANINNKLVFGVHGDLDKTSNVVQNLTLMTKLFPSYICMGHIHHMEENEIHGVEVIVNSTLSGTNTYAKNLRLTSKPSQKFMIFSNEERECTYNIILN